MSNATRVRDLRNVRRLHSAATRDMSYGRIIHQTAESAPETTINRQRVTRIVYLVPEMVSAPTRLLLNVSLALRISGALV